MTQPLCVAHRGYSARFPENTLTAHQQAIAAGADVVETDARFSADGDIFCVHDPDLGRLIGDPLVIEETPTSVLRKIELARGERLMMLKDLLGLAKGRAQVLIDIKATSEAMADALLATTRDTADTIWFGFRDLAQLRFARRRAPELRTVALLPDPAEAPAWWSAGVSSIRLWESDFTEDRERQLGPHGPIWITAGGRGTADAAGDINAARMEALLRRSVAAILVNDPAFMLETQQRAMA